MEESPKESISSQEPKKVAQTPFRVDFEGIFPKGSVKIRLVDGKSSFSREITDYINKDWQDRLKENPYMFNGELVNFQNVTQLGGQLIIEGGVTDFKTHMASSGKKFKDRFRKEFVRSGAGMSAIVVTRDNYVLLAQRGKKTSKPGTMINAPAGFIDLSNKNNNDEIDIFDEFKRELKEETLINPEEIKESYCAGLVRGNYTSVPDLVILAITELSSGEIADRINKSNTEQEDNIIFVKNDPKKLANVVLNYASIADAAQLGAKYLFIKMEHGDKWAQYFLDRIQRRSKFYENLPDSKLEEIEERKIEALNRRAFVGK